MRQGDAPELAYSQCRQGWSAVGRAILTFISARPGVAYRMPLS